MLKRFTCLLLIMMLTSVFIIGVGATGDGAIKITTGSGYAGRTIKVDVVIDENPGMIASVMTVSYDTSALTLTRVEDKGRLGENNHSDNLSDETYYISWFNPLSTEDFTYEGTVLSLSFEIAEDANIGDYDIELSVVEAYNAELSSVEFIETAGKISVVEKPSTDYIPGDIDMDGTVRLEDAVLLFKHSLNENLYPVEYGGSLDFTGDEKVDIADAVKVFKHSLSPDLYPLN